MKYLVKNPVIFFISLYLWNEFTQVLFLFSAHFYPFVFFL